MKTAQIPEGVRALGPEVTARVQRLVADAEIRQEAEADAALDKALAIVPRPLRGVVRRVLIG
jgi:hypothetical protein